MAAAAAAVGSIPEGLPSEATWNTYVVGRERGRSGLEGSGRRRQRRHGAVRHPGLRPHGGVRGPGGRGVLRLGGEGVQGAGIVNEHGSLNFNGLNTRDVAGAKSFYGSVFGWTTLALPAGEMWTLPGYGDYLERDNPGLREQVAEMGGPEGFVDVVASIIPIAADQPDTPAHWNVTFAVDDADAAAAKATELGGTVVAPPFDAPWVRMTILNDPQGATFVASQFVAENMDLGG